MKAVIFDFGGVISRPLGPIMAAIERDFALPAGTLATVLYGGESWRRAEVGDISYDEYIEASLSGIAVHTDSRRRAAEVWARWYHEFYQPRFMPGMIELVRELQGVARVAMLSNASDGMEVRLRDLLGVAHLFDPLVSSAAIRVAKPDPRAFTITLDRLGLPAGDCFFIDDTPVNIEAATKLGIHAHLFKDGATVRTALRDAGLPVTA